jgi:hypothetical protein
LLTQNLHLAPSTQQAEQAGFTREEVARRASQFSLKINKRQSSSIPKLGTCRVVPDSSIFTAIEPNEMTHSYREPSASKLKLFESSKKEKVT